MDNNIVEILMVEDTEADAELAIRALRKRGFANHLVWVKDGAEALDFIFATGAHAERNVENRPKVVLLDLRLPKVSGIEVLRRIKQDNRTASTRCSGLSTLPVSSTRPSLTSSPSSRHTSML